MAKKALSFNPKHFAKLNILKCIGCGHETTLLEERKFVCPDCGDLYDVVHPQTPLLSNHGKCFVPGSQNWYDSKGSSVWAFRDLVLPGVPTENIVSLGEKLHIVPVAGALRNWVGGDLDLWMALEGVSPTGSFKDFGMTVLATVAKLAEVSGIACASTGDTSAAAAAYAAAAGLPCVVLLPKGKVTPSQLVQPLAHGARVLQVPGDFDACMRILQELVSHHGVYPANSLNPARIEGHQATVFNSWLQFGKTLPDWFVLPLGNGSNTSSIGKGITSLIERGEVSGNKTRILSVQPEHSAPLAESFEKAGGLLRFSSGTAVDEQAWHDAYAPVQSGHTIATAAKIGSPVSWKKVIREIVNHCGGVISASDKWALEAMFAAGRSGHMVCPQTGLALAGLRNCVKNGQISSGSRVVVVSTAHGLKFANDFLPQDGNDVGETLLEATTSVAAKVLRL